MRTIPWSWYEDPEVARRERDRIFMRSWQYAGRTAELTAPGSYVATQVGGLPVVLTRDRDDTLRAFANVCRHRGAIVARGAGERGTLQCPYHAWTYGLDGCLRGAPRTRDDPGFDTEGLGLVPMAAGTWGPFAFVNPDADAEPLEQALGDLPAVVAAHGLDVAALRLPPSRRVRDPRELEDRARELPRVLPLPAQPPGARLADRRPAAGARGGRAAREPVQPRPPGPRAAGGRDPARPVPPVLPEHEVQRAARARRTSRSGRSGRSRPTAAAGSSTTSSRRTRPRSGSRSSSPSTTRSGRRTPRWSRAPRRARAAGSCRRGGCSRTTSSSSRTSSAGCGSS